MSVYLHSSQPPGGGKYSGRREEEEGEENVDYVGQGGGHIVSPPFRAALSRTSSLKVGGRGEATSYTYHALVRIFFKSLVSVQEIDYTDTILENF